MHVVCSYNGVSYKFPAEIVAHNAAKHYSESHFDTTYDQEYDAMMNHPLEIIDWAINNMDPTDIPSGAYSLIDERAVPGFDDVYRNSDDWKVVD